MTEAEAMLKWCPFTRTIPYIDMPDGSADIVGGIAAFNRLTNKKVAGPTNPPACRCLASNCMAWRWEMKDVGTPPHPMMAQFPPYEPNYQPTEHGFCGLACRP